jgi:ribose 5-phosphate isomerase B
MIAAASDHAGFPLKSFLVRSLTEAGHKVLDLGTHDSRSVHYPDFAHDLCRRILTGECGSGILVCNSGIGMSIAANRHRGIRAALCLNTTMAAFARRHNNANVLVLAGGFTAPFHALEIVDAFLSGEFEGGRHAERLELLEKGCGLD